MKLYEIVNNLTQHNPNFFVCKAIYGLKKIRKIHLSVLNIFKTVCYFVVSCSQKGAEYEIRFLPAGVLKCNLVTAKEVRQIYRG